MSWRMKSKLLEPELLKGHQDPDPGGHRTSTCWSPFTGRMMTHDPVEIEACSQHCWPSY